MRKPAFLLALFAPGAAWAQVAAGLPDPEQAFAALDAAPTVQAAQAQTAAARAEAEALARGPGEFTLTTGYASRTVHDGGGVAEGRFDEFSAELTRPVRLPGKRALDRAIGAQGTAYAANMAEDARHQTALTLAQGWCDWLGAAAQAALDRAAVDNYSATLDAVTRRAALRDAATLEVDQARAALEAARADATRSAGRATLARARLAARFPGLPLPTQAPAIPDPVEPDGGLLHLRDRIVGRSHELAAAQAALAQARARADRARLDRRGDPTLGLRVFSEKGGMEKGAGVLFALPFGGGWRSAQADRAAAQADAAQADLHNVELAMADLAESDVGEARTALDAWGEARAAREAQGAVLARTRRGQALGELSLADVLLAERMMHEARRGELTARAEALRALTRIRIDAHELWIGDADDH